MHIAIPVEQGLKLAGLQSVGYDHGAGERAGGNRLQKGGTQVQMQVDSPSQCKSTETQYKIQKTFQKSINQSAGNRLT